MLVHRFGVVDILKLFVCEKGALKGSLCEVLETVGIVGKWLQLQIPTMR